MLLCPNPLYATLFSSNTLYATLSCPNPFIPHYSIPTHYIPWCPSKPSVCDSISSQSTEWHTVLIEFLRSFQFWVFMSTLICVNFFSNYGTS
jgi:hypothetical protein